MATKLKAIDGVTPPKTKRSPVKIAVTFALIGHDGRELAFEAGAKLLVKQVYRDLAKFADVITDDPSNVPLFAKIEVPFQS